MAAVIERIISGSIAEALGIQIGDSLAAINGKPLQDIIDYNLSVADEFIKLDMVKPDGGTMEYDITKDEDEDLGLVFSSSVFDGIRRCENNCDFCFVSQLPPNCRSSLRVKDDDYRMSFLEGSYITCTNLTDADVDRIIELRLSPLYISVHVTSPPLRRRMLKNDKAGDIMQVLHMLKENGICFHGQIVLCPEINDGEVLINTLNELEALRPELLSLAVVPVGLSAYQKHSHMRLYTRDEAKEVIDLVTGYQKKAAVQKVERGSFSNPEAQDVWGNYIFLADEFYLLADDKIPSFRHYGDFPQLENGVGMIRLFLNEWRAARKRLPKRFLFNHHRLLLTGRSAYNTMKGIAADLMLIKNLQVEVLAVTNRFFGESVTVTGLVTGTCIEEELRKAREAGMKISSHIVIPTNMLKYDSKLFLDGQTVSELSEKIQAEIVTVSPDAFSLAEYFAALEA